MKQLLIRPFVIIAGGRALLYGLLACILTAVMAMLSNCHFDGAIDAHVGAGSSWWVYFLEPVINLACVTICFYIAGRMVSASAIRLIDVAGTLAFARWPMLFVALLFLLPMPEPGQMPGPLSLVAIMLILIASIGMIALMYQAYTVSCNVKGTKATVSFIGALLAAELISKILFYQLNFLYH